MHTRGSSLTSCTRFNTCTHFPAGCDPLAHLFLKYFRVLVHFIATCVPECCSSLVCRRQLQSCSHDPLWAEATSNGLYYYPPHSSGGNIQPTLGCLGPKLVPQGKGGQDFLSSSFPTYFHCSFKGFLLFSAVIRQQTQTDPSWFHHFPQHKYLGTTILLYPDARYPAAPIPTCGPDVFCIPFSPPPGDQKSISMYRKNMKERGLENHKCREESEGEYCSLQGKKIVRQLF